MLAHRNMHNVIEIDRIQVVAPRLYPATSDVVVILASQPPFAVQQPGRLHSDPRLAVNLKKDALKEVMLARNRDELGSEISPVYPVNRRALVLARALADHVLLDA